ERRHSNRFAQRGLPGCDGQRDRDIAAVDLELPVRFQRDLEVEVARGPASETRSALAGQPDALSMRDARGNRYAQRARLDDHIAFGRDLRCIELDHALRPAIGVLELDLHARNMILAARGKTAFASTAALRAAEGSATAKEL